MQVTLSPSWEKYFQTNPDRVWTAVARPAGGDETKPAQPSTALPINLLVEHTVLSAAQLTDLCRQVQVGHQPTPLAQIPNPAKLGELVAGIQTLAGTPPSPESGRQLAMVGVVFGAPGLVAKLASPETQAAEKVLSATGFCASLLNASGASLCPSMRVIFDATSLIAETQRQDRDYVKMILRLCKLGTSLVDLFGGQLPPQVGATVKVGAWLWDFSREDIVQELLGTVRGAEVQFKERISGKREEPDS